MMRPRFVLLTTFVALIGVPSAGAATPILGPADGVQATRTGATLEVTFTGDPAKWRPLVGREVVATCRHTPDVTGLRLVDRSGETDGGALVGQATVGADGVLRYTLGTKTPFDACSLSGFEKDGDAVELAQAALTPNGAVWIDESRRAQALHELLDRATRPSGYRPLVALGAGIVALDGPDGTPAAEATGYWTDGKRASVAMLSAAGRRLVIEDLGQGMLRTNVLEQSDPYGSLFDDPEVFFQAFDDFFNLKKRSPYRGKLPLARLDGVRVSVAGRRLRMHFEGRSGATFRKLAGRRITALCGMRPAPTLFPPPPSSFHVRRTTARIPRTGDAIALTLSGPPGDLCVVLDRGTQVAIAGTTTKGRHWLQDIAALGLVVNDDGSGEAFAPAGASSYGSTAAVLAHAKRDHVAMSGPDGRVPVGHVGVWTDGARRAAQATTSASGWHMSLVDEGEGMVRTNLFGRLDLWTLLLAGGNG